MYRMEFICRRLNANVTKRRRELSIYLHTNCMVWFCLYDSVQGEAGLHVQMQPGSSGGKQTGQGLSRTIYKPLPALQLLVNVLPAVNRNKDNLAQSWQTDKYDVWWYACLNKKKNIWCWSFRFFFSFFLSFCLHGVQLATNKFNAAHTCLLILVDLLLSAHLSTST